MENFLTHIESITGNTVQRQTPSDTEIRVLLVNSPKRNVIFKSDGLVSSRIPFIAMVWMFYEVMNEIMSCLYTHFAKYSELRGYRWEGIQLDLQSVNIVSIWRADVCHMNCPRERCHHCNVTWNNYNKCCHSKDLFWVQKPSIWYVESITCPECEQMKRVNVTCIKEIMHISFLLKTCQYVELCLIAEIVTRKTLISFSINLWNI